jgi:hypothetical protein
MENRKEPELAIDLAKAKTRLDLIARMAKLNMDQCPSKQDFEEILQNILAACGTESELQDTGSQQRLRA